MNDIFKKGYKQPLEESDIHEVLERDSSYHLQNRLKRYDCGIIAFKNGE